MTDRRESTYIGESMHGNASIWPQPRHRKAYVQSPFIQKGEMGRSRRFTDSDTTEYLHHSGFAYPDTATDDDSGFDLSADDDAYTDSSDGPLDN